MQAHAPLVAFPATALVVPEPLGVVLIFSCWNLPIGENETDLRPVCNQTFFRSLYHIKSNLTTL